MIGWLRLVLGLAIVAIATPPMALWQIMALRTGWVDEGTAPRLWHHLVTRVLGIRIHVHGQMATQRPLLIASNHISWTDIMVLGSLADLHFIAKLEVGSWPLLGRLAKLQRTVFVDRGARRKAGAQVGEIASRISDGDPMVLFPEGSTGDGNVLLPFKSTLFAAAASAMNGEGGEPPVIQPVAIVYTRLHGLPMGRALRPHIAWIGDQTLVPHLTSLLRTGAVDVEVHFGTPISVGPGLSRKHLARDVEQQVRTMMAAALRNPR